jgi:NADPH:quinone reductase-like Zn-dependent oxidoreductase
MKYIDHGTGGSPDVLELKDGPMPEVGAGEVLIKVAYAGLNRPDVSQRSGRYPPPADASPHIGLEVAGEIAAVGQGVDEWKKGDRVCALTNGGGYAEFALAPAGQVLPVPAGLSLLQAAALPENYFTVWANLIEGGRLAKGETALIHGGTSGIGITAIQMAKAWGARVFCTVGSDEKAAACTGSRRRRGHQLPVAGLRHRGVQAVRGSWRQRHPGHGGRLYIERNLRCLRLEGRLVQIAFLQPSRVEVDWMPLMIKRPHFHRLHLAAEAGLGKSPAGC